MCVYVYVLYIYMLVVMLECVWKLFEMIYIFLALYHPRLKINHKKQGGNEEKREQMKSKAKEPMKQSYVKKAPGKKCITTF